MLKTLFIVFLTISSSFMVLAQQTKPVFADQTFGIAADGITNDREGLRKALKVTATDDVKLIIDKPIYIQIRDSVAIDPIEIFSNTNVEFQGRGVIIVDNDKLPVFWSVDKKNIKFTNAVIKYAGVHSLKSNAVPAHLFVNYLRTLGYPGTFWNGPTGYMTTFYFMGVEDLVFNSPKFISNSSDEDKLFAGCIVIQDGQRNSLNAKSPAVKMSKNITITNPVFDGVYMGMLTGFIDGIKVTNVKSIRYGALTLVDGKGWASPPHVWYNTGPTKNLILDGLKDEGVQCGKSNWGQSTLKFRNIYDASITNIVSLRNHGALLFDGSNIIIDNVIWKGDATIATDGPNGIAPMGWAANIPDSIQQNVQLSNVKLTDVSKTYRKSLFGMTNSRASRLRFCKMTNIKIEQELWGLNSSTPYFASDYIESCDFDVSIHIRTPYSGVAFIWRAGNGSFSNKLKGSMNGLSSIRIIGTQGTIANLVDVGTGKKINLNLNTPNKLGIIETFK